MVKLEYRLLDDQSIKVNVDRGLDRNCFILITVQKIVPLILISLFRNALDYGEFHIWVYLDCQV